MPEYAPHSHVFVDESKVGGYYVAASVVAAGDVNATRKAVRALLLPKQKRIHFTDERDDRRKKLLKDFARLNVAVSVYVAKGLKDKEARPLCLTALAEDVAVCQVEHLYLEKDDSSFDNDKRVLARTFAGYEHRPRYAFPKAHEEPLLWVSDAVAWCYQKRGPWVGMAGPLVSEVCMLT
ncbi:hypothetical protein ACH9DO_04570 [Kocuria sp. M1N1S27]|uniref:hypothetical protein n=1 Tax=Kocuria kalidii TaxID=3376283 RepID=UPI00378DFBF2